VPLSPLINRRPVPFVIARFYGWGSDAPWCVSTTIRPQGSEPNYKNDHLVNVQHYNNAPWSQKKKWRLLWTLILRTPHIGANVTVTLSLVPITIYNAFATKYTGLSICYIVYDDTKMLKCVRHSVRSAMCSELPTAISLFLPN